jgi:hypothetical protein
MIKSDKEIPTFEPTGYIRGVKQLSIEDGLYQGKWSGTVIVSGDRCFDTDIDVDNIDVNVLIYIEKGKGIFWIN